MEQLGVEPRAGRREGSAGGPSGLPILVFLSALSLSSLFSLLSPQPSLLSPFTLSLLSLPSPPPHPQAALMSMVHAVNPFAWSMMGRKGREINVREHKPIWSSPISNSESQGPAQHILCMHFRGSVNPSSWERVYLPLGPPVPSLASDLQLQFLGETVPFPVHQASGRTVRALDRDAVSLHRGPSTSLVAWVSTMVWRVVLCSEAHLGQIDECLRLLGKRGQ